MLDQYIVECMVAIININNDAKEHAQGYQHRNTMGISR